MFHKYLVKIHEHENQNETLNRNYFASVCMLGWAKPDLWGLGGESLCNVASLHYAEMILRCTMTLLEGPKDSVLPNLVYVCTFKMILVFISKSLTGYLIAKCVK